MQYNIPQILAISNSIRYNPAVATAVNALLNATTKVEYEIALQNATEQVLGYQVQGSPARKNYGRGGTLGAPLFQPLTFKAIDGLDALLLESAVLGLTRTKNVVTTAIQGREGTVKEFISNGDWSLSFSGILVANGYDYPLEQVQLFNQFMELNKTLQLEHEVLNALGIYEAVVMDYALPPTTYTNVQSFSIQMLSDVPFELIVNDLPDLPNFL